MFTPIESFLEGQRLVDTNVNNFSDAIRALVESNADIVTYRVRREFLVNNINVFERVADNKVKYEVTLRDGDIFTDLQSNVPFVVTLGHLEANPADSIVSIAAQYTHVQVTFYLDPLEFPEHFTLSYKVLLLGTELRRQVLQVRGVSSGSLGYVNGSVVRL